MTTRATGSDRWRHYAATVCRLDLRSLAAMRIGLGVIVLVDLLIRSVDLAKMYTDAGVLSRADRLAIFGDRWAYSIYDLVAGSPTTVALLFGFVGLAAVAMILGVFTRAAIVVCWLSTIGLTIRMPLVITGGDTLLAALLLWSAFLPMDARYSLAARKRSDSHAGASNLATFALLLQVGVLFAFAGASKLYDPAWRAGDGVYYALTAEFYTTSVASWALDVSPGWLLAALTFAVVVYEIACPVLLLIPTRVALWRGVFVGATIFMNLSFWLCLRIGIFSWVAVIACIGLLPGEVWDWLERTLLKREPAAVEDRSGRLAKPVLGLLAALLALMMLNNMRVPAALGVGKPVHKLSLHIGLNQRGWPMFSPTSRDQGYFLLLTRLDDKRVVDLSRGGAKPVWQRPDRISAEFDTYRQRKYMMNLKRRNPRAAALLLRYECRRWNKTHQGADRAEMMQLVYMRDRTLPGNKRSPVKKVVLAAHKCD